MVRTDCARSSPHSDTTPGPSRRDGNDCNARTISRHSRRCLSRAARSPRRTRLRNDLCRAPRSEARSDARPATLPGEARPGSGAPIWAPPRVVPTPAHRTSRPHRRRTPRQLPQRSPRQSRRRMATQTQNDESFGPSAPRRVHAGRRPSSRGAGAPRCTIRIYSRAPVPGGALHGGPAHAKVGTGAAAGRVGRQPPR